MTLPLAVDFGPESTTIELDNAQEILDVLDGLCVSANSGMTDAESGNGSDPKVTGT